MSLVTVTNLKLTLGLLSRSSLLWRYPTNIWLFAFPRLSLPVLLLCLSSSSLLVIVIWDRWNLGTLGCFESWVSFFAFPGLGEYVFDICIE